MKMILLMMLAATAMAAMQPQPHPQVAAPVAAMSPTTPHPVATAAAVAPPASHPAMATPHATVAAGTAAAQQDATHFDADTAFPNVNPAALTVSPHSYGRVVTNTHVNACACISQPVCACRARFAELEVDPPHPPVTTTTAPAATTVAAPHPAAPQPVHLAPGAVLAGTDSFQTSPPPASALDNDLTLPNVDPAKLQSTPYYTQRVVIAGTPLPCMCAPNVSPCACATTTAAAAPRFMETKVEETAECGCLALPACPCRPNTIAPEIVENPAAMTCGCPVCPCSLNCGCNTCPCPQQPAFVVPEIRTPVCGCIGQPACGCAPAVTLASTCPCIGQVSCGCWVAPQLTDKCSFGAC